MWTARLSSPLISTKEQSGSQAPVELLFSGSTSASKIKQSSVATPLASTTGADICADPSGYYVNYHSTQFSDGSIRGQLG